MIRWYTVIIGNQVEMTAVTRILIWLALAIPLCWGLCPQTLAHGRAHVHSDSGNGPSHRVSQIWNDDGSYSISESYINGWSGRCWSKFYSSWNKEWSYSGNSPGAPLVSRARKRPVWNPRTIQPTRSGEAWIRNPFFREK